MPGTPTTHPQPWTTGLESKPQAWAHCLSALTATKEDKFLDNLARDLKIARLCITEKGNAILQTEKMINHLHTST